MYMYVNCERATVYIHVVSENHAQGQYNYIYIYNFMYVYMHTSTAHIDIYICVFSSTI